MPNELPFIRGQSETWPVTIYQDDGTTPVDLTGYAVSIEADGADIDTTTTIADATNGRIDIVMTPAQTGPIAYRQRFRIKLVSGGGEVRFHPNSPAWLWLVPQ